MSTEQTTPDIHGLPRDEQYPEVKRRLVEIAEWFSNLWINSGETPLHNLSEGTKASVTYAEQNEACIRRAIRGRASVHESDSAGHRL